MDVITRFAPSPTGMLHIGGARTALFNWLYAKSTGGKFLLRIEDTDRERSTPEATTAIFEGLKWLGLHWDGTAQSQHDNQQRHRDVANELISLGKAYKCFCTEAEIELIRKNSKSLSQSKLFQSPWRNIDPKEYPNKAFVIRLKTPLAGNTTVKDEVQGSVTWKNETLEDLVLLRSDGDPTYMLAVVVDDHDSGITHIIRGDDHLSNAAKQTLIYEALDWKVPIFAHIPLIFGDDGKKMSKRHGATGTIEYQRLGYTPAGMRNYLARLGWSHGDDEFFSTSDAIAWFNLTGINKSPARFDFKKLDNINGKHINSSNDSELIEDINRFNDVCEENNLNSFEISKVEKALYCLKQNSKKIPDLLNKAHFFLIDRPVDLEERAKAALSNSGIHILKELTPFLEDATWTREGLEFAVNNYLADRHLKLGQLVQPLKAALSGRMSTPSVFDMMVLLGPNEVNERICDMAHKAIS
jgi:glutamyl-tRNA synthetase